MGKGCPTDYPLILSSSSQAFRKCTSDRFAIPDRRLSRAARRAISPPEALSLALRFSVRDVRYVRPKSVALCNFTHATHRFDLNRPGGDCQPRLWTCQSTVFGPVSGMSTKRLSEQNVIVAERSPSTRMVA